MARVSCKAVGTEGIKYRGQATVEWHDKEDKPQYYCYGYFDYVDGEIIDICRNCRDFVDQADEDMEYYSKMGKHKP